MYRAPAVQAISKHLMVNFNVAVYMYNVSRYVFFIGLI
jgi:hypothetical protein